MVRIAIVGLLLVTTRPVAADATVMLQGDSWDMHGGRHGTVSLAVNDIVVGTDKAGKKVAASKQLANATLSIDGTSRYEFFIELRDGHRYVVKPDPCCFLVVYDLDDDLGTRPRCGEPCPHGTVEIARWAWHGHDCGDRPTCAPPAQLRVRGDGFSVTWDGDALAADGAYHSVAVGRESPQHMIARRNGKVVWQADIVVHHGGRYTLDLADPGAPRLLIDGTTAR